MDVIRRRPGAQYIVLAAVIAGHVLLIEFFFTAHPRFTRTFEASAQRRAMLLWLEPPSPQPSPKSTAEHRRSRSTRPPELPATAIPLDTIHAPSSAPRVDWYREAEEVIADTDLRALALKQSGCEQSHPPGSLRPRCKKRRAEYHWEPEPKRAGFSGGIPYVRLGKRCVIALGGFGCALGKLPKEGGDLFERMRDPDRPTSSVPDIPSEAAEEATQHRTGAPFE